MIRFDPAAEQELKESVRFYEDRAQGLGADFFAAVELALQRIIAAPERFRSDREGVRICPVSRFPFTIRFVVEPEGLWIVALAHDKRRPGYWQSRLNPPGGQ